MPKANTCTRTIQLWVQGVTFWQDGLILPTTTPLPPQLLLANSVTLWMDNQKYVQGSANIHHTAFPGWFCPVKALAHRGASICSQNFPTPMPLI
jgi:hypothetical protein